MAEIKFGNQRLIDSNRICCYNNDSVSIRHQFNNNETLEMIFNFHYDEGESHFTVNSLVNGCVVLDLYNFKSTWGTGITSPQVIAKYNQKNISIVFFVTVIPNANPILDFSLYMEE